jgi:uracil-DNA glycosylase
LAKASKELPSDAKPQIVADVVNDFPSALDLVMGALEQIRDDGGKLPRASRSALSDLQRARPTELATPQPPARERSGSPPARQSLGGGASLQGTVEKAAALAAIQARVAVCVKCPHLARTRTQTVFGVGNPEAELMFIGEAPGADEDRRGEPFVGRAGELLTKIIKAMGFERSEVYIANVLKCRPDMPPGSSGNRPPTPDEMQTCLPYLTEQIDIIQPRVLVALGATAVEGLLGTRGVMRELRGKWHSHQDTPLMITYHPSYLLRNQTASEKRKVWEDMLLVMERLGRPITEKQRNFFR